MPKKSLKQQAYDDIKNKILNCEYAPGSFLNEDLLCENLKISRTPVRDALSRLEQENLVTIFPKKGFQVYPLTINEINMVYEGRALIEPYFIRNYCWNLAPEILDSISQNIETAYSLTSSKSQEEFFELDSRFHEFFVSQCTNRYLVRSYNDMQAQNYRLRILSGKTNEQRLCETADEHALILKHLIRGEIDSAAEALKNHLLAAKKATFDALVRNNTNI